MICPESEEEGTENYPLCYEYEDDEEEMLWD